MKKIILLILVTCVNINVFSISNDFLNRTYYANHYYGGHHLLTFSDMLLYDISFEPSDGSETTLVTKVYDYNLTDHNGLLQLSLIDRMNGVRSTRNILVSEDLILDMDSGVAYAAENRLLQNREGVIFDGGINYTDFSSILTEGSTIYQMMESPENRKLPRFNFVPWAVKGKGTGQFFKFSFDRSLLKHGYDLKKFKPYILFINGFASKTNPNLFEQNSRVKNVLLEFKDSKGRVLKQQSLILGDTMRPQLFEMEDISMVTEVLVTIKDIYEGTKFEDTCLSWFTIVYKM